MKKCSLRNIRLLAALVVGLMFLASCAKEECVAPATAGAVEKGLDLTQPPPIDPADNNSESGRGKMDPDPGDTISDDGDDLSDKERSNKKKAN